MQTTRVDSKCRKETSGIPPEASKTITIRSNIGLTARETTQVTNYKPEIPNPHKYGYLNNWNMF